MNSVPGNCAVKIAVRECPGRDIIRTNAEPSVISYHPINKNVLIVEERAFSFDYVLRPSVTQKEVFEQLIRPLVVKVKQGFNCTALAYGQTGTGKSYTMGLGSNNLEDENAGVIPRCLKEMFEDNENKENDSESPRREICASFIEIYNEKVYDLLAENIGDPIVGRGYKYTGGTRKPLNTLQECYDFLTQGNKNRHVRPTKMNSQSSRSHAIFTIHVSTVIDDGSEKSRSSCLNIVDLAGSEGVRRTGHQGVARSEGININQGLLCIGKVLQAITLGNKVIPYRDSVLSSVLQDSLNPNSYLTLLACVSPHREDLSETLSTLRFAQTAKQLKNTPQMNTILAEYKRSKYNQTQNKANPLHSKNALSKVPFKHTPFKGPTRLAVKSNTFCTPKKMRHIDANKCNRTESNLRIGNDERVKLSVQKGNNEFGPFESTQIPAESLCDYSLDSMGSLISLNVSASTAVDIPAAKKALNFSPIIRKYVSQLNTVLEAKFVQMLQTSLRTLAEPHTSEAPTTSSANSVLSNAIRHELKDLMKEVLFEKNPSLNVGRSSVHKSSNTVTRTPVTTTPTHRKIATSSPVPHMAELSEETPRPTTSSPRQSLQQSNTFIQDFFSDRGGESTIINKSLRRSRRISQRLGREIPLDDTLSAPFSVTAPTHIAHRRRSLRKSVRRMCKHRQSGVHLEVHTEVPEPNDECVESSKAKQESTKPSKPTICNGIIASYCNNGNSVSSTTTTKTTTLAKHRKAVLELLNKGSMKELQILPQIGQKTAFQIVTQRTLNGKFRNLAQVERLPIWRGNAWERFAQANVLI